MADGEIKAFGLTIDIGGAVKALRDLGSFTEQSVATGKKAATDYSMGWHQVSQKIADDCAKMAAAERQRQQVFGADQSVQYVRGLAQASTEAGRAMRALELEARTLNDAMQTCAVPIGGVRSQLASATAAQQAFTAAQDANVATSGNALAGFGRIRQGLTSLVASMTGTIPILDRIGGQFLTMGAGGSIALAVVAGIAAIAGAWYYLSSASRDAAKQQEEHLKSLREEIKKTQDAMGDLTLAAARANVATAEAAVAQAKNDVHVSASRGGRAIVGGGEALDAAKRLGVANALSLQALIDKTALDTKAKNEAEQAYAQNLALLIQSNHATEAERARALKLYRDNEAEITRLGKSQTDNVRRGLLIQQDSALRPALFPTRTLGVSASADDTIAKLQAETDGLLAENAARTAGASALDAWKVANAGALAVEAQLQKQRDLTNRAIAEGKPLTASAIASLDAYLPRVRAAAEAHARAAIEVAHFTEATADTRSFDQRAAAVTAETDALQNGTISGKQYQLALEARTATEKAEAAGLGDALGPLLASIELWKQAALRNVEVTESIKHRTEAAKRDAEYAKAFREEQQRLATVIEKDVLGAIRSLTTNGLSSFRSFFSEIERLSFRMVEQFDSSIASMRQTQSDIINGGSNATWQADFDRIQAKIQQLEQFKKAATWAGGMIGAASAGYQIGQQSGDRGIGAIGGAAAGAAAGSVAGPWGVAAGALVGLTAGIIGAGKAAAEAAKHMQELQTAAKLSMESLRVQVANNSLESQRIQIDADREARRKAIEDAYSGGAADSTTVAARNAALAEMNRLEDQLFAQAKTAYETAVRQATEDVQVQILRNNGLADQADALAHVEDQERRFAALRKQGVDESTIAALALSEAAKLATDNALKARDAQRAMEDLDVRILNAKGLTQAGSDAAFRNQQQREYQDAALQHAQDADKGAAYLALLTTAQVDEAIQRAQQIDIQNQTKVIQDAADLAQKNFDAQLQTAQDALKINQAQLQAQQQAVQATQRVVESLTTFAAGLSLNTSLTTLSPVQQLAEARKQFNALLASAQGGDKDAAGNLPAAAQSYLTASRAVNASGTYYVKDFLSVQAQVDAVKSQYGTQLTTEQQILQQLQAQNAALSAQIDAINAAKAQATTDAAATIAAITSAATNTLHMLGAIAAGLPQSWTPPVTIPVTVATAAGGGGSNISDPYLLPFTAMAGNSNRIATSGEETSTNTRATVVALQAGLSQLIDEVAGMRADLDANGIAQRRAMEGASL